MNIVLRKKTTSVSMVNFHIVICPRYRRKIFLCDGVERRFKELVSIICEQNDYVLLGLECDKDHVHLFVNVPPDISAADVVRIVKTNTSRILRQEFKELCTSSSQLWTQSYFVSTAGNVSADTIQRYIETQKLR